MKTTMRGSSRMATLAPVLMAMGALGTLNAYAGQGKSGMAVPDARRDKQALRAAGGPGLNCMTPRQGYSQRPRRQRFRRMLGSHRVRARKARTGR